MATLDACKAAFAKLRMEDQLGVVEWMLEGREEGFGVQLRHRRQPWTRVDLMRVFVGVFQARSWVHSASSVVYADGFATRRDGATFLATRVLDYMASVGERGGIEG